jgi:hypothetical protein
MAMNSMTNLMLTNYKKGTNLVLDRSVDLQDVKRLLELGKILSSVLTEEEFKILQETILPGRTQVALSPPENR